MEASTIHCNATQCNTRQYFYSGDELSTRDSGTVATATMAIVTVVMPTWESCMCFWSIPGAQLPAMMRIVILIMPTVLMLATLRFMWMSMPMLVTKWRFTIGILSIVQSVRQSGLWSVCLSMFIIWIFAVPQLTSIPVRIGLTLMKANKQTHDVYRDGRTENRQKSSSV